MGVDKCRDPLTGGVLERNNGTTRILGFMDFKEVESGCARIRDMEEGAILISKTMEKASKGSDICNQVKVIILGFGEKERTQVLEVVTV